MAKKKSKVLLFISVLFLILLISGIGVYLNFVREQAIQSSKYYEVPTFGYISCQPIKEVRINKNFGAEIVTVSCARDSKGRELLGTNNGCTIILTAPNEWSFERRSYSYRIIGSDGVIKEEQEISGGIAGYEGQEVEKRLSPDDSIVIAYGGAFFGKLKSEGQSYSIVGSPFALYNYNLLSDTNGQRLTTTRDGICVLEDNYYKNKKITYASPEIEELKGRELDFKKLNEPFGTYTYFNVPIPVPAYSLKFQTYNKETVYCKDNALYKIFKISTADGNSYNIVNYEKSGFIKEVPCCNGDETVDKICQDNQWIDKKKAECDLSKGIFCPQSSYSAFGDKQYKRYNCVNMKCVEEVITVTCNSNDDCKAGESCVFEENPKNNYCVQSGGGGMTPPTPTQPSSACKHHYMLGSFPIIPNIKCFGYFETIRIISTILGILISFLLLFTSLLTDTMKTGVKATIITISVLLSLLLGLLIYQIFWLGMIVLIFIFVIKPLLPSMTKLFKIMKRKKVKKE